MLSKFTVCSIKLYFISAVFIHACFQIIALNYLGSATEISESIYMSRSPAFLIHGEESFNVGISAVRKSCNKYVYRNRFTCICINNVRCISCPVHLHYLTGLMLKVHSCAVFGSIVTIILFELRQLIRQFFVIATLLTVFKP